MPNLTIIFCETCRTTKLSVIDDPALPPKCKTCQTRNKPAERVQERKTVGKRARKVKK